MQKDARNAPKVQRWLFFITYASFAIASHRATGSQAVIYAITAVAFGCSWAASFIRKENSGRN